jgi:hypothetical protein
LKKEAQKNEVSRSSVMGMEGGFEAWKENELEVQK